MKTKQEYKDIKIMKINSPTKDGSIFTEVSLPKQTMVDFEFNNKPIGIATNFRIENDFVICDISLDKKLLDDFNNAYPSVIGSENVMGSEKNMEINKGEIDNVSIGNVAHSFKECENNLLSDRIRNKIKANKIIDKIEIKYGTYEEMIEAIKYISDFGFENQPKNAICAYTIYNNKAYARFCPLPKKISEFSKLSKNIQKKWKTELKFDIQDEIEEDIIKDFENKSKDILTTDMLAEVKKKADKIKIIDEFEPTQASLNKDGISVEGIIKKSHYEEKEESEKEYNPIEDRLEQLTKHVDKTIAKEMVKINKEKEELKTLYDLNIGAAPSGYICRDDVEVIEIKELIQGVIKWIKEDKKTENIQPLDISTLNFILDRWMKRFNISEKDLK